MTKIDHYMVDYEDFKGDVHFANDTFITDLKDAKALAKRRSKQQPCSAAVVAYAPLSDGTYDAVGDIKYFDGVISDRNGVLA